ncbi:MAG: thiamine pyrophosphate-requiring protein [Geminicoccaceae bacterium]
MAPCRNPTMNVAQAVAAILKKEGVDFLFCYPTSRIIDEAALQGIRPLVVRQERTGLHMADALSRMSSGKRIGVFAMQHGPGAENSYGGVAQAYAESVPILVIPQGYPQRIAPISPNFSSATSMRDVSKSAEALAVPAEVTAVMRRAFSRLRNGRGGPVVVEVPSDLWGAESPAPDAYVPVAPSRYGPAPDDIAKAVELIAAARSPVIYAGQGVHWSQAWSALRELAELLAAPVATTLSGKSAFPEDHPLSLGSGGLAYPAAVRKFLADADLIIGIGCSFTETVFAVPLPSSGPRIIHATLDPDHLGKDVRADVGLVGDAQLTLAALIDALRARGHRSDRGAEVAARIKSVRDAWLAEWMPKLTSDGTPLSPYRVIWELMKAVEGRKTVITNDAGRPRDQLSPFWIAREPLDYIGWGKTTQLGYGLGLAMGAKLARPESLCINVWGDAAIGFTGTDLETAARERIPILSVLFNNQGMATELANIPNAIARYDAARITGNYADMARALGCYSERITSPDQIQAALGRGICQTEEGRTVLLEFMTAQENVFSRP